MGVKKISSSQNPTILQQSKGIGKLGGSPAKMASGPVLRNDPTPPPSPRPDPENDWDWSPPLTPTADEREGPDGREP